MGLLQQPHAAALPGGADNAGDGVLQPLVGVGDHELHALEPALGEVAQESRPEGFGLGGADVQADDLALALGRDSHRDYGGDRNDAAALAHLEVSGIQPEIGPLAGKRALEEGVHALVDVLAELADRRLADARHAHGLHQTRRPVAC